MPGTSLAAGQQPLPPTHQRAIEATAALLAEKGIKGTSLRDIAQAAGVNAGNLASYFGSKERIVAECFRQTVAAHLQQVRTLFDEAMALALPAEYGANILWTLCEAGGTHSRTATLVLGEMILAAEGSPLFSEILSGWVAERRRLFRDWGRSIGIPTVAVDALALLTFSESCFYLSCGHALRYRIVAMGSLAELFELCSGTRPAGAAASLPDLARPFFTRDLLPASDAGEDAVGARTRAQIIEAAADIVGQEGLDGVTGRGVAQRAEISLGLISYHFPSVTNLALAGLNRLLERVIEEIDDPQMRLPVIERLLDERRRPVSLPRSSLFVYRSMLQLALAAGRMPSQAMAGEVLRRRLGSVVTRAMRYSPTTSPSRTLACSFALITIALFTILPAIPEEHHPTDLEGLLQFLTYDMLGFEQAGPGEG